MEDSNRNSMVDNKGHTQVSKHIAQLVLIEQLPFVLLQEHSPLQDPHLYSLDWL